MWIGGGIVKTWRMDGKQWRRGLAAFLGAGAFLLAYPAIAPGIDAVLGRATLLSAAFSMPGGALETIRQRYAGEVLPESQPEPEAPASSLPPPEVFRPGEVSPGLLEEPESAASALDQPPEDLLPPPQEGEPPEIPEQYQAVLQTVNMTGEEENSAFCRYRQGGIRNYTKLEPAEIDQVLEEPAAVLLEKGPEPQVLIYHTHTTESYEEWDGEVYDSRNNWRSQDNTANMAAVGEELAQGLRAMGIQVLHDETQHDYPAYNGAYDRSAATIKDYLEKYPSIKVAIDVHRDAVLYDDGSTIKVVQEVAGHKAAQLMVIAPCDDGSVGVPGWKENFRFAAGFTSAVEERYPGLMRPVFFCYRNYNLWMTPDSLLFEFGTNGNTLEEAKYTARLVAPILGEYLLGARD